MVFTGVYPVITAKGLEEKFKLQKSKSIDSLSWGSLQFFTLSLISDFTSIFVRFALLITLIREI